MSQCFQTELKKRGSKKKGSQCFNHKLQNLATLHWSQEKWLDGQVDLKRVICNTCHAILEVSNWRPSHLKASRLRRYNLGDSESNELTLPSQTRNTVCVLKLEEKITLQSEAALNIEGEKKKKNAKL